MAAPDQPSPNPSSAPDTDATRYRNAPADPDRTGYRTPDADATNYRGAPADPDRTGYPPTPTDKPRQPASRTLPCRFGEYELVEEIARGGMGVVYKARQRIGGGERFVALKMIQAGRLASPEALARFQVETQAAAKLDHPGIVPIYDVGEWEERHYFTMPLLAGGSLADRVRNGPLPAGLAARIVVQVAEAVQHAHEHGIIHRDLKPANILLHLKPRSGGKGGTGGSETSSGSSKSSVNPEQSLVAVAKVTDFGLARTRDSGLSVTGEALGTPSYMPPEQARGQVKAVGPASDTYGLGAVLYCLVTGRPPFQSADPVETMRQVCEDEPVPPRRLNPQVPRDLETICLKCLQKEPGRRYGSAEEVAEDLRRFLEGRPIHGRPVSKFERAWRWARRNPWPAGVAALLLMAMLGLAVYLETRPAYLDVRVKTKGVTVLLDGQPLELEEGGGRVTWRAGRFLLHASAPGHEDHEQPVLLVRGSGNVVVADVDLVPRFGYCKVVSEPKAAEVELVDKKGVVVDSGVTPFSSERLASGEYTARVRKDGYHPQEVSVTAPLGEQQRTSPVVKLVAMENMTEGMALLALMRPLMEMTVDFAGIDDPRNTLAESLEQLQRRYRLQFDFDEQAFKSVAPDVDVLGLRVAELPIPPMKAPFGTVLNKILSRVNIPSGVTVIPKLAGDKIILRITTGEEAAKTFFTILHPVGDLTKGSDRQSPAELLADVREHLLNQSGLNAEAAIVHSAVFAVAQAPATVADCCLALWVAHLQIPDDSDLPHVQDRPIPDSALRYLPTGRVLYTLLPWSRQEQVVGYLDALRKAALVKGNEHLAYYILGNTLYGQRKLEEAAAAFQMAIRIKPDYAEAHYSFGDALYAQKKSDEARAAYLKAIELQPDGNAAHRFGERLRHQGSLDEAVAAYRKAIQLEPEDGWAYFNLGTILQDQKKLDEARAAYLKAFDLQARSDDANDFGIRLLHLREEKEVVAVHHKAVQLMPDSADAYAGLGRALYYTLGGSKEAVVAFRKAIELRPKHGLAYFYLGLALRNSEKKFAEASAAHHKAIELQTDCAKAINLGNMLSNERILAEAVAAYRKAVQLKPDSALAYFRLGVTLDKQGKRDEAVAAYRKAIQFEPGNSDAHYNLGILLSDQNKFAEAAEAYRKAIQIRPDDAEAYSDLGLALHAQGKLDEAVVAFRKAIELRPKVARGHLNLGRALFYQAEFKEALTALKNGHDLLPTFNEQKDDSTRSINYCERFLALDARLPAVLKGTEKPASATEQSDFGELCYYKHLYAASARFYRQAFAVEPSRADEVPSGHRYNAARSAARAGCGQGKDASETDDKARGALRPQAHDWLRADLIDWGKKLNRDPANWPLIEKKMQDWQTDPDLAGVRDTDALAKLPEPERQQWQKLWTDVADLRRRAAPRRLGERPSLESKATKEQ